MTEFPSSTFPSSTGLRCVVFDVDDTLYLERDYVRSGFQAVGRHLASKSGARDFASLAWQEFEGGRRGTIFDVVLAKLGLDPGLVPELVQVYRAHTPDIRLLPGMEPILERLSNRGVLLAAITDGPESSQAAKVESLRLARWIPSIRLTATWGDGFGKPHPRAFEEVQARFGVSGEACAYIADNPHKDFQAPAKLGWRRLRMRHPLGLHAAIPGGDHVSEECDSVERLDAWLRDQGL